LRLCRPRPRENNGVIQGRVTGRGTNEGIGEVQITLQGPTRTFDRSALNGLYAPRADLTREMRDQIARLIDTAPPDIAPEVVANAAARMEAQLLGLPAPAAIPASSNTVRQSTPAASPVTAMTEADGTFSFKKLAPGRYTIRALRDGYYAFTRVNSSNVSGTATESVTVEADETTPPVTMAFVQGGVIAGTLHDPNGKILPNLNITAYQIAYRTDGRAQLQSGKSTTTDDRGDYRLFHLPPGDYLVAVNPRRPGPTPSSQDVFAGTFYPGVSDPRAALPVTVTDGGEMESIDIAIRADAKANRRQNAALYKTTTSNAAGAFTLNGVAPGEYKAFAIEEHAANAWLNADFLRDYEPRGMNITVTAGAPTAADLTLIVRGQSPR
jgi:uncharacterized protein (DUF2141 family)